MACGDCWSHALEGFLSPVADDALRAELATLIARLLECHSTNDPTWFELSAAACAGQARSSVGLVHGIAHTLEGPLSEMEDGVDWGHATLCSTFLHPVMQFNEEASAKPSKLLDRYGIDLSRVLKAIGELHDEETYREALPALAEHWRSVVRDPCTRTNCALVRPKSLEFFRGRADS